MRNSNKWLEEIISSLTALGGKGSLADIYQKVEKQNNLDLSSYVDWKSQIRKNLYLRSSDCDIFKGTTGDETDLFYSIEGKGKGIWGLRNFKGLKK